MSNGLDYEGYERPPVRYNRELTLFIEPPHLGHAQHLCEMARRGANLQTVKNLVKDAKFICRQCGRVAVNEENLCEPVPL